MGWRCPIRNFVSTVSGCGDAVKQSIARIEQPPPGGGE